MLIVIVRNRSCSNYHWKQVICSHIQHASSLCVGVKTVYYREDVFIESYNITQITDISSLASFPVHILSKPAPERLHQITSQDFNETRVAVVHQLVHMQIICTLLQTDNHGSTSPLNFSQAGCSSWHPTNSVKALKAIGFWLVGLIIAASNLKEVDITQQVVAIYPQPLAGCKPKLLVNVCVSLCTTVILNTAQNSSDNLPSYPPDSITIMVSYIKIPTTNAAVDQRDEFLC